MSKVNLIERPRVTIGAMIFDSNRRILLLHSPKWNGLWIFPCGHVEFGEKLGDAVRREVMEETSLVISNIKFLRINEYINPGEYYNKNLHSVGLQFLCQTNKKEVIVDGKEADSFVWVKPKDALKMNLESSTRNSIVSYLRSKGF